VSDVGLEYTVDIVRLGGEFAWYELRQRGALVKRVGPKFADVFERHLRLYIPPWKLFSEYARAKAVDEACIDWMEALAKG